MKGEGCRSLKNGGVYINGIQERRSDRTIGDDLLLDGSVMVIRHGKSTFRIIEVLRDEEAGYEMLQQM